MLKEGLSLKLKTIRFCVRNACIRATHFTPAYAALPVGRGQEFGFWLKNGHDCTHFVLFHARIDHAISVEATASVRCHAYSARLARNFATRHASLLLFLEPVTLRAIADPWRHARSISARFLADWLAFASHRRVILAEFVAVVAGADVGRRAVSVHASVLASRLANVFGTRQ